MDYLFYVLVSIGYISLMTAVFFLGKIYAAKQLLKNIDKATENSLNNQLKQLREKYISESKSG